jgi:hypothetical protein
MARSNKMSALHILSSRAGAEKSVKGRGKVATIVGRSKITAMAD